MNLKKVNPTGQGWCSMTHAFKLFWTHYADFTHSSTRSEYWWWQLWNLIINLCFLILTIALTGSTFLKVIEHADAVSSPKLFIRFGIAGGLWLIWRLASLLPRWSLEVRRFNDLGLPIWVSIVLLAASIVIWFSNSSFLESVAFIVDIVAFIFELLPSNALAKFTHK